MKTTKYIVGWRWRGQRCRFMTDHKFDTMQEALDFAGEITSSKVETKIITKELTIKKFNTQ